MTNISEDLLIQSLDDNGILRLTLNDPNNIHKFGRIKINMKKIANANKIIFFLAEVRISLHSS